MSRDSQQLKQKLLWGSCSTGKVEGGQMNIICGQEAALLWAADNDM